MIGQKGKRGLGVVGMIKLGMSNPAFLIWKNEEREMVKESLGWEVGGGTKRKRRRALYGSNMKTSTAVYKDLRWIQAIHADSVPSSS